MAKGLAIDMGTYSTRVYQDGRGIVADEPSVVAMDADGNVRLFGNEALERAPHARSPMRLQRPMQHGAIANFEATEGLIRYLFHALGVRKYSRARFVGVVASGSTPTEQRALAEAASSAGASDLRLIEQPLAAAIGAGLPIQEPLGSMMVNVGAGTTNAAVVSLGSVVASRAIRVGSGDLDEAIRMYLRREHGLVVTTDVTRELKHSLGAAQPGILEETKSEIEGLETDGATPKSVVVSSNELVSALDDVLGQIVAVVLDCMSQTSPEMAHDLITNGIALSGGGALLRGLDARLSDETGLKVRLVDDPASCAAAGAGRCLDAFDSLRNLLINP